MTQKKTTSLKERYYNEVRAELKKEFNLSNDMQIPRLHKIVLNMGVGEASHNSKLAESIVNQLTKIAGQKALACSSFGAVVIIETFIPLTISTSS